MKKILSLFGSLIIGSVFLPVYSFAQSETPTKHEIKTLTFLEKHYEDFLWTEDDSASIDAKTLSKTSRHTIRNYKKGVITSPGNSSVALTNSEPLSFDCIDVHVPSESGKSKNVVKGMYRIKIPSYKRVQLELDYHVLLREGETSSPADFYAEVFEPKENSSDVWEKSGEFKENNHKKRIENMTVLEMTEPTTQIRERLTAHSYNANLSKWAGKEIMIALVAASTDTGIPIQGRWVQARLVGCTFDFKIVPIQDEEKG